jgi:hypothetical protein
MPLPDGGAILMQNDEVGDANCGITLRQQG